MHYGFAPGRTEQDKRARRLFQLRAGTELVSKRRLTSVQAFIQHLDSATNVTRPVEDLLLGAHANSEGWLFIPMYPRAQRATSFETLEETLADPDKSVAIPDTLIDQDPDQPLTHFVHIKGCNIGKARAFLIKLKEALGDHVNVTAPKHFHGLFQDNSIGICEYMEYEFSVRRPDDLPDRAAILAAFEAESFQLIDGTPVASADLDGWIPRRRLTRTQKTTVIVPLGTTLGSRETLRVERQFRVERIPFTYTIEYPSVDDVPPAADRRAAFEEALRGSAEFSDSHPFPWHKRVGYDTIDDFFAGYQWQFGRSKRLLTVSGTRVEYTLVIPIVDTTTGNVIFNFHPKSSSGLTAIIQLAESDGTYFEAV